MPSEQVDLNKWKALAREVLGDDFFTDIIMNTSDSGPRYNLYRSYAEITVLIELPFVYDLSKIHLTVKERELSIKGKIDFGYRHLEAVQEEIFSGNFERKIPLPEAVNTKKVNARYQRGILTVQLYPSARKEGKIVDIKEM